MNPLIDKFLNRTITEEELVKLTSWLKEAENQEQFKTYLRDQADTHSVLQEVDVESAYKTLEQQIKNTQRPVRSMYKHWMKYAAAAVIIIATTLTILFTNTQNLTPNTQHPVIVNNNIIPGTKKAILTLEDGSEIVLEKGGNYQADNVISNGEVIIYKELETRNLKSQTNTLTIPRGGEFFISLSDGTKVWLNSESKLKYPANFIGGETRQVELIYGEAYFEVTHSTENQGAHFKVFVNNQEVEVLGTKFNIKAYQDDTDMFTTLVSGKVAVNTPKAQLILEPGDQAQVGKTNSEAAMRKVNVGNIVSWIEGNFDFKDMPLDDIMKVLARWYDMDVVFQNSSLKQERFSGRIGKQYGIEDILNSIKGSEAINSYEIHDKTLTIK